MDIPNETGRPTTKKFGLDVHGASGTSFSGVAGVAPSPTHHAMRTMTTAPHKEMFMARIGCTTLFVLAGLAALAACGGTNDVAPTWTTVIDTSSLRTDDAIAQAAAAEHGAPGDNEQIQYVLVGENASANTVASLHERGFANVSVGSR